MSRSLRLAAVLGGSLFISLAAASSSAATFTYGSGAPERANFHEKAIKPMMKAIDKATDGRVKFRGLYGGTVVRLDTTLQGIRDGIVDSGYVITVFHPAELPRTSLIGEMGALSTNPYAAAGAASEILLKHCKECLEELKAQKQEAIFSWGSSPMTMVCTGAVKSGADLHQKRVSVIGSSDARWATLLGMSPTRTAISDLASSLQLGRSDCAIVPINWIRSYGLGDIAKTVLSMPQGIGTGVLPLGISSRTWSRISAEDQAAIRGVVADNLHAWISDAYLAADDEVRRETQGKITYIDHDEGLEKQWLEHQELEVDALIELAKRRGIADAETVVKDMAAIFRKWHEVHLPEFKDDPKVYAEVLRREVFGQ